MMLPLLELTASAPPPAIVRQLSSAQASAPKHARIGYRITDNGADLGARATERPHVAGWKITTKVRNAVPAEAANRGINDFFVEKRYVPKNGPVTWLQVSSRAAADKPSLEWWTTVGSDDIDGASVGLGSIIDQISVLSDGWAGVGSVAPSAAIRSDVSAALSVAPAGTRLPAIEIDEDGTVALLWEGIDQSFALTFYGNGKVVGTLSPYQPGYAPWRTEVADRVEIGDRLGSPELIPFLS